MADAMDAIIARGLPAIDPVGDYYKTQNLQLEQRVRMQQLAQNAQLQPYKLQEAQQTTQINQAAIAKAQRDQEEQESVRQIIAKNGGDLNKALPEIAASGRVGWNTYDSVHKQAVADDTAKVALAKTQSEADALARDADASGMLGVVGQNYDPKAYEAQLHRMVDRKRITEDQFLTYNNETDPEKRKAHAMSVIQQSPTMLKAYDDSQKAAQELETKQRDMQNEGASRRWSTVHDADSLAALKKLFPKAELPDTYGPDTQQQVRMLTVPAEKQPEVQLKQADLDWMKDPERLPKLYMQINSEIDPTKGPLYASANNAARVAVAEAPTRKDAQAVIKDFTDRIQQHESNLQLTKEKAPIQINVAAGKEAAKEQQESKGVPDAFASVNPKDRHAAQSSSLKIAQEYNDKAGAAKQLQDFVVAAQSGNKAAPGLIPIAEVKQLLNRVNRNELQSVSTSAGSAMDRLTGWFKGYTEGQSISPDVLKDISTISGVMESSAYRTGKSKMDSVNQTYGSKAELKRTGGTPATPQRKVGDTVMYNGAAHKIKAIKPDGKLVLEQ